MGSDLLKEARKELLEELSPAERVIEWAKKTACQYHIMPNSIAHNWESQREAKERCRAEDIQDRINSEWERSPEGQKWEREHEDLARFGKVLTATDYAEKRADLENDPTIDRGDIEWMMGSPNSDSLAKIAVNPTECYTRFIKSMREEPTTPGEWKHKSKERDVDMDVELDW